MHVIGFKYYTLPATKFVCSMYLFIVEFTQTSIRLGMYIEIGVVAAV